MLQSRLAHREIGDPSHEFNVICSTIDYLPTLIFYKLVIALLVADMSEGRKLVLLLVSLIDDWARSGDDLASIFLGLFWIGKLYPFFYDEVINGKIYSFVTMRAKEFGDEEIYCRISGKEFRMLSGSSDLHHQAYFTFGKMRDCLETYLSTALSKQGECSNSY